MTVAVII